MKLFASALFAFAILCAPISVLAITHTPVSTPVITTIPFYSQFSNITSAKWQKVGCGITSLAMLISFYKQTPVSVDTLLAEGIKANAYSDAGWTYSGLLQVAKQHGLTGTARDLSSLGSDAAFTSFTKTLIDGPVIASVHYKFEPKNPIPHLVVVYAVKNGLVYYNDPAAKSGEKTISVEKFQASWKKRFVTIRKSPSTIAFATN